MCITKACADPTEPGVYWREDDCWKLYSPNTQTEIKKSKEVSGSSKFDLGSLTSDAHPSGEKYEIDLKRMVQVNVDTGHERQVLIIGEAKSPQKDSTTTTLTPELETDKDSVSRASEELFKLITDENFLRKAITDKHKYVRDVIKNPHLDEKLGLYVRFSDAIKTAAAVNVNIITEIFSAVKQRDVNELKSLEFVFHGSPSTNVDSILKNGLDASYARVPTFWVGQSPDISLEYCRGAFLTDIPMVLLLELTGTGESPWSNGKRSLPLTNSSVLLPVAKVLVDA